ncbi:MAG: NfeD family protein [Endomicrobium sp.]|jgi:membrane protein implicated in regulation of membrane protease activity|nr:NfeD family protein [Endomicrobium sp.]
MIWIDWIIIAVVFVIFEMLMPSAFSFICFSVGSLFVAIASYFDILYSSELLVFIIVSILSLCFIRPIFKKFISKSKTVKSNVDILIDNKAIVVEKITSLRTGFVKILNEIWRAKSNVDIEIGEVVKIRNISGTTLIVEKGE